MYYIPLSIDLAQSSVSDITRFERDVKGDGRSNALGALGARRYGSR
jgi:hypothetical protein